MLRWRKKIRYLAYILSDLLFILCALILTRVIINDQEDYLFNCNFLEFIGVFSLLSFFYIFLYYLTNTYKDTIHSEGRLTKGIIVKMTVVNLFVILLLHIFSVIHKINLALESIFFLCLTIYITQFISRKIIKYIEFGLHDSVQTKNIVILGVSEAGSRYIQEIKNHDYLNYHLTGYIQIHDSDSYDDLEVLGSLDQLEEIVTHNVIDELAVAKPLSYDLRIRDKLNLCQCMGITITMLLELQNTGMTKADVAMVGKIPVLKFHVVSLNEGQLLLKRLLDVSGASIGMLLFGLVYLMVAPLIKLESPGPVLFKHTRVGKNGRLFTMLKFRTMVDGAENLKQTLMASNEMNGHIFKIEHDPRVTRLGAILRKSSLDEFPQFLNVMRGDMSLVGTRPPTVEEFREYEARHRCRLSITPGVTGLWQVSGRSEIKDFEEIVQLDTEYISNWSLLLDLHIILKTIVVVLRMHGSS